MKSAPLPLNPVAQKFWDRHYDRLTAAGILTDADLDSFAVLALTWGKIASVSWIEPGAENFREMVQLDRLIKQYQTMARQFGLMPLARRAARMDGEAPPAKDEFGL